MFILAKKLRMTVARMKKEMTLDEMYEWFEMFAIEAEQLKKQQEEARSKIARRR